MTPFANKMIGVASHRATGWAQLVPGKSDGYSYQLTMPLLEVLKLQFCLHTPTRVFKRRPDLALDQATCFELVLELKTLGFKDACGSKKAVLPFEEGLLPKPMHACLTNR